METVYLKLTKWREAKYFRTFMSCLLILCGKPPPEFITDRYFYTPNINRRDITDVSKKIYRFKTV